MLLVEEAQQVILKQTRPLAPEVRPVGPDVLGLVLAEAVASDLDMPPYDKALMDGYAVRAADVATGRAELEVIEEILAGHTPRRPVGPGQATRIMTGAPLPEGADAVVVVERTRLGDQGRVILDDKPAKPGQNILYRGREMKEGEVILAAGTRLNPQEIGLLSAVGRTSARVHPAPRVHVLPTGDEIVEPGSKPGPGQIRNSNGPMLLAQVARAGGVPRYIGIARDNPESLRAMIAAGLEGDVLILSGGVSAGKADLVPDILQELGVAAHFQKVKMKPGKPVFFGTRGQTPVFGLPGNPVSSLVCFELFVRPAIRRLRGLSQVQPPCLQGKLVADFSYRTDRPTYYPARVEWKQDHYEVHMLPWFGSADLRALAGANGFALIAEGEHQFRAGHALDVLPVDFA